MKNLISYTIKSIKILKLPGDPDGVNLTVQFGTQVDLTKVQEGLGVNED